MKNNDLKICLRHDVFNNSGQGLQIGDVNGKDFILGTWPIYSEGTDRRKQYRTHHCV